MRPLLSLPMLFAAVTFPVAAAARPSEDAPVSHSLPSDEAIDRSTLALDRMIDALLQIDVAPLVDAIEPDRPRTDEGHGEPETLGDIARRHDPGFDERLHRSTAALAGSMIAMKKRMRKLEPALRRSLKDIRRSMKDVDERPADARDGY